METIREIQFLPNVDAHDFEFRSKQAKDFLKEGFKLKVFVQFNPQAIVVHEKGESILLDFIKAVEKFGSYESLPILDEEVRVFVFIHPKIRFKQISTY